MFVFGSSPKRFGDAENSFVAVASSTWTSSPTTSSYAVEQRHVGRVGRCRSCRTSGGILEGLGDPEHHRLAERRGEHLHADGQAAGAGAERHAHAGSPERFDGIV